MTQEAAGAAARASAEAALRALDPAAARAVARAVVGPLSGDRRSIPSRRHGISQEARLGEHTIHLHTGEFPDGSLGEIFINSAKDGESFRALLNCFAIAVSLGLQHGAPLDAYVRAFVFTKFEPRGIVRGPAEVRMASSPLDYIFRVLAIQYLERHDLGHKAPDAEGDRNAVA